jgi:hypothetical protein
MCSPGINIKSRIAHPPLIRQRHLFQRDIPRPAKRWARRTCMRAWSQYLEADTFWVCNAQADAHEQEDDGAEEQEEHQTEEYIDDAFARGREVVLVGELLDW